MPRLLPEEWSKVRAEYEVGASLHSLAQRYGVSRTAIGKKIRAEGWTQDPTEAINRLARAKVAGVVTTCNPEKKAEALANAADRKADVLRRHMAAWPEIKALNAKAIEAQDFDAAKLAKITAETERIIQDGERKAWGISDKSENEVAGGITIKWAD